MDKTYTFVQPIWVNGETVAEEVTKTGKEIIDLFWPFWNKQMIKKYGENYTEKYTLQDCIDDFCVTYWAVEKDNNAQS